MSLKIFFTALVSFVFLLSGCSSSATKQRKEQQAKLMQTSKLYCEFLDNGVYLDIDVALNIEMAKRCDLEKPYTIAPFKTVSESTGIIYCCSIARPSAGALEKKAEPVKSEAPKKPASSDSDGLE
jgi:hypothetical protein